MNGDSTSGLMPLLLERKKDDGMWHTEGKLINLMHQPNDKDHSIFTFQVSRCGDYSSNLMFQVNSKLDNPQCHPIGYPYCLIDQCTLTSNIHSLTLLTGKNLWCMIQTFPDERRKSVELAATYGMVYLRDFVPPISIVSLPYDRLTWTVDINQNRFSHTFKAHESSLVKTLSTIMFNGIEDLSQLVVWYAGSDRGRLSCYNSQIFLNTQLRDLLSRETSGTMYPVSWFKEWIHTPTYVTIDCNFSKVLQFNMLIERPDCPNTFFKPNDRPLKSCKFELNGITMFNGTHDELYLVDKLMNDIPITTHVAHYTHTFQTFENFQKQTGELNMFNNKPIPGCSHLNMKSGSDATLTVALADHIPPHSKICFWIVGAKIIHFRQGSITTENL